MNKRLDSPNFCSTLDGLLPKFKRPRRIDPLSKTIGPTKHKKAKVTAKVEKPRLDRDRKPRGIKHIADDGLAGRKTHYNR